MQTTHEQTSTTPQDATTSRYYQVVFIWMKDPIIFGRYAALVEPIVRQYSGGLERRLVPDAIYAEGMRKPDLVNIVFYDRQAADWMPDVVIKRVPVQPVLSYRDAHMTVERLYQLFDQLCQLEPHGLAEKSTHGPVFTVLYSDIFTPEATMDLEIGVVLTTNRFKRLRIADDVTLTMHELPAVEQLATIVHRGMDDHPTTYNALGRWLEQHQYRIVGPGSCAGAWHSYGARDQHDGNSLPSRADLGS
jgi:YD repeat-containing protein